MIRGGDVIYRGYTDCCFEEEQMGRYADCCLRRDRWDVILTANVFEEEQMGRYIDCCFEEGQMGLKC